MRLHETSLTVNLDRYEFVPRVSQQISDRVQKFQACMLLGQPYIYWEKTYRFIPKPGTKHLVPVSCKQLQTFHAGTSSYRSEFVPVSCKYPLNQLHP